MGRVNVIYTRFSSDMQRTESCDDQEREVRTGLRRLGIDPSNFEVVYDRAASGTKTDRALFDELRQRIGQDRIGIVAVDDQSRFSRADNAFSFITDLVYSGGRFISIGEGIDTAQEGWELRVKVMELHNSTTIRELGHRVRRGQLGRVIEDGSAGDYPFGYESYFTDFDHAQAWGRGPRPKKGISVNEQEARWVRQVFEWFANEQKSISWIARKLTELNVQKGHRSSKRGWHHQQVRRMLSNTKYVGQWTWSRTKTMRSSRGKVKQVAVPEERQIHRQRPFLRIVEQATWDKAQHRLRQLGDTFGKKPGQKRRGPTPHFSQVYPQSLLGGLLTCQACGSRLWRQGTGDRHYLGCPKYRNGSCRMPTRVPVERAETAICDTVGKLLSGSPQWVETTLQFTRSAFRKLSSELSDSLVQDQLRATQMDTQIDNIVSLLADGNAHSDALMNRLRHLEREAQDLKRSIVEKEQSNRDTLPLPDDGWVKKQLQDLTSLLREDANRSALFLRRVFESVYVEAVIDPGKTRPFMRLHLRVNRLALVMEALGRELPKCMLATITDQDNPEELQFQIDLRPKSRMAEVASDIEAMRNRGLTWKEIGLQAGRSPGSIYNAWRRLANPQSNGTVSHA